MPRDTTQWKQSGTDTFRLSSSKLWRIYGGNHQNKSDELSRIYIPDKGKEFVQVDQAGAEALVVAYLCKPGKFRDLFLNNIKSHTFVATHLFAAQWLMDGFTEVFKFKDLEIPLLAADANFKLLSKAMKTPKYHERYFIGKKTCHSANYMMKENTFQMDVLKESGGKVRLSLRDSALFLKMYHTLFPEIREWQIETEQTLSRSRLLRNLQGFPRVFTQAWSDGLIRSAVAFVPQSTVGTITNIAIANMQAYIEDNNKHDWDILNNKHDSFLCQCPIGEGITQLAPIMKSFIEQELTSPRGEKFKMKSEASVGMNWGTYKEPTEEDPDENLDGLKVIE